MQRLVAKQKAGVKDSSAKGGKRRRQYRHAHGLGKIAALALETRTVLFRE
jgi:hypothetical protein